MTPMRKFWHLQPNMGDHGVTTICKVMQKSQNTDHIASKDKCFCVTLYMFTKYFVYVEGYKC